jgi:hypothetical protein
MITEILPKRKRFVETSTLFAMYYSRFVLGRFAFQQNYTEIIKFKPNTVYLIERVSVSCDIPEETYLNSIDVVPMLVLSTNIDKSIIYEKPINVTSYKRNEDISTFVTNGKEGDSIVCRPDGLLKMVQNTVGLVEIKMFVQFSIFAMDQNDFNSIYNNDIVDKTAKRTLTNGVKIYV